MEVQPQQPQVGREVGKGKLQHHNQRARQELRPLKHSRQDVSMPEYLDIEALRQVCYQDLPARLPGEVADPLRGHLKSALIGQ